MGDPERLAFGLVPPPSFLGHDRINALLRWIGERAGVPLVRRHASSYDELVKLLRQDALDVVWLPPIPFARLEGEDVVRPLVSAERGGESAFVSILFARTASTLLTTSDLQGRHIGWVDPLSTSGYVVPRMRIAVKQPLLRFGRETFFGSHAAVMRAVLEGTVDAGASYGGFSPEGELIRGAFIDIGAMPDDLRVLERFDAIPPDIIAVHTRLSAKLETSLADAFVATAEEPAMLDAVRTIFGAMYFTQKSVDGYDTLRHEVDHGVDSGVIPAAAAFLSTRPPPRG